MKLFHAPASPFVRKVMVLLHLSGRASEVTLVPVSGHPLDPGNLPVDCNPLGKIPALLLDDGRTLYDSRVICRYLDTRLSAGLYPQDDRLWDTLTLEATGDGIADAAVLMRYETSVRPAEARSRPGSRRNGPRSPARSTRWNGSGWTISRAPRTWGTSRLPARSATSTSATATGPGGPRTPTLPPGRPNSRPGRPWQPRPPSADRGASRRPRHRPCAGIRGAARLCPLDDAAELL